MTGLGTRAAKFARGTKKHALITHPSGARGLQTTTSGGKILKPSQKLQTVTGKTHRRGGGLTDEAKVVVAGGGAAASFGGLYANKKVAKMDDPFKIKKAYNKRTHARTRQKAADKIAPQAAGGLAGYAAGSAASKARQGARVGHETTHGLNALQVGGRASNIAAGVRNAAAVGASAKPRGFSGLYGSAVGMVAGSAISGEHASRKYLKANPKPEKKVVKKSDPFEIDKAMNPMGALSGAMKLGQKAKPALSAGLNRAGTAGMAGASKIGAGLKARPLATGLAGGAAGGMATASMFNRQPQKPKQFGKNLTGHAVFGIDNG